jgi:undecaprenyl pyrophosphate phosphatase UppP
MHKALFAFISGFSELFFIPVGAQQLLYQTLTGYDMSDSFLSFGIHLGCLVALLMNCYQRIKYLRTQKRLERTGKRRRGRQPDVSSLIDIRILNTAVWPILLGLLLYQKSRVWIDGAFRTALILIINGFFLFLPRLLSSGNKDSQSFTRIDGLMMGIGGSLGVFPGFNRLGCMYSMAICRGADRTYALNLSMLLSIPATIGILCIDIFSCTAGLANITGLQLLCSLVAFLTSSIGANLGIGLIRFTISKTTTVGFAYYSWGLAIFLLLIYLFVS